MEVSVKVITAALAATVNLILIVLVTLRSRGNIVYRSFVLINFCLLFWNLRIIISDLSGPTRTGSLYEILKA